MYLFSKRLLLGYIREKNYANTPYKQSLTYISDRKFQNWI